MNLYPCQIEFIKSGHEVRKTSYEHCINAVFQYECKITDVRVRVYDYLKIYCENHIPETCINNCPYLKDVENNG